MLLLLFHGILDVAVLVKNFMIHHLSSFNSLISIITQTLSNEIFSLFTYFLVKLDIISLNVLQYLHNIIPLERLFLIQ